MYEWSASLIYKNFRLEVTPMDIMITIAVIVISICCVITIKIFTKDGKHDLEIQAGKFRLSIKKHE